MANNLKDHLKEVADAIRAKKGTSDLINPQDFATEIEGITSGGGSGESLEFYYLKTQDFISLSDALSSSADGGIFFMGILMYLDEVKVSMSNTKAIMGIGALLEMSMDFTTAISIRSNWALASMESDGTISSNTFNDLLAKARIQSPEVVDIWDATPKITKEQFYDLNA